MLEKIQFQLKHLNKSKHKAAEVILASPDNATHSSIVVLALEVNVSELTVNRFCRNMDICGFPDFRLHLAQSLANGIPYISHNVNKDGSVESYMGKIFESAMTTLDHIRHSLDKLAINRAVDLLTQVKEAAFFGLSSSTTVACDAMNKFFRFNVPVVYSDDTVLQRMSCTNCSGGDMMVLISHIGRTKNPVELMQLVHGNGAMIIALASAGAPLTRGVALAITPDVLEDTDVYMSMVSRLAQLAVIDVPATGFTLRRGVEFGDSLKRVKETPEEPRFGKQLLNLSDDH